MALFEATEAREAAREPSPAESIGEPLDSHLKPIFLGCSRPRRESISGGEESRGADEAVVSEDPPGQHNPMASQGPLDGRVGLAGGRATLNRKVLERVIPTGIAYSWELQLRWRIRRNLGAHVDGT